MLYILCFAQCLFRQLNALSVSDLKKPCVPGERIVVVEFRRGIQQQLPNKCDATSIAIKRLLYIHQINWARASKSHGTLDGKKLLNNFFSGSSFHHLSRTTAGKNSFCACVVEG